MKFNSIGFAAETVVNSVKTSCVKLHLCHEKCCVFMQAGSTHVHTQTHTYISRFLSVQFLVHSAVLNIFKLKSAHL